MPRSDSRDPGLRVTISLHDLAFGEAQGCLSPTHFSIYGEEQVLGQWLPFSIFPRAMLCGSHAG